MSWGNARGGSTFANAAFGIHPKMMEVRWNDKTFSSFWPKRETFNDNELRQMLLRPPNYYDRELAISRIGEANVRRLEDYVADLCEQRDLGRIFCLQGILFWIMRSDLTPLDELHAWCVKANTWQGVDLVKSELPEARIIFIERDPRSTTLSLAKAHARTRRTQFDAPEIVQGALDWLRNAAEFGLRLKRHKGSSTWIRYEDLVMDSAGTLNGVYSFLGLDPLAEETVAEALSDIFYKKTQAFDAKKTKEHAKKRGVQTEGLDRWRRELSVEQLGIVTSITAAGARHFGYDLETGRQGDSAVGAILRAGKDRRLKHLAVYFYCRARFELELWTSAR